VSLQSEEVVGPRLRKLLVVVLVLFAVLVVNSVYLAAITFMQWLHDVELEGLVYQSAFLLHLAVGFMLLLPALVFVGLHLRRAIDRPNRLAIKLGLALFAALLLLLVSGVLLTRGAGLLELNDAELRATAYWIHVLAPLAVCWLFVLHRLAGPRIRWAAGGFVLVASAALGLGGVWLTQPSQKLTQVAADSYFFPALSRTASGNFIAADELMRDEYCAECHSDIYDQWQHSAHRFSSFNNPAYRFSVRKTREVAMARDGDVQAARFCAGCHDPVPLFSGAFDDPAFDDETHPTAAAGITCITCHGIEQINSPRGNGDYLIASPVHYPFAFAESEFLRWVNRLSIKAKPAFHKRTFLKPLHTTAEFCGACHKAHLPVELNQYKWLRGQNHYDSFLLSGVSGHGVQSFYYPDQAHENCNSCHMPLTASTDFGAASNDDSGKLTVHNHQFPGANTALAKFFDLPDTVNEAHRAILEGSLRADIFALREGREIGADVVAPLRPRLPGLTPGKSYVIDVVLRTLTLGHSFTEGTSDSNEVWLDVTAKSDGKIIGRSGAIDPATGAVDPWAHFVNVYALDRHGKRIDRRNAEDIFTRLYDHQIPAGAADVVHYALTLPPDLTAPVTLEVALHYRKFDAHFVRLFGGDELGVNTLPIVTIATDTITLPLYEAVTVAAPDIPAWQRWNDYGIGFLLKPDRRGLKAAEAAFRQVIELGQADGDLNLARVLLREGRLQDAAEALRDARDKGAYPWSVAWFTGLIDMQNGEFDAAIGAFTELADTRFVEARRRGFDFSKDYRLQNELALAYFERSKLARTDAETTDHLDKARSRYRQALVLDPENLTAHYGLAQVYARLGNESEATAHRQLHETYRPDDNSRDLAVQIARQNNPAADHAAEPMVIYDLQRAQNYGLPGQQAVRSNE